MLQVSSMKFICYLEGSNKKNFETKDQIINKI